MEKPFLLHMFTPTRNVSPFDVNMAYDAGYFSVIPYADVALDQVAALTQDAIFSRGPKGARRTGIFIGGRDITLAGDMLDAARKAMVPPFEVSVFADPSGAFTTAAAMVALVERQLQRMHQTDLQGRSVLVLGGTGPVGSTAAVLAAGAGAKLRIASHSSAARAQMACQVIKARYGADAQPAEAISPEQVSALVRDADVVLATAKAGVQVVDRQQLGHAASLLVAADINAVPPSGIEGLGVMDDGAKLASASGKSVGIGALAIGNVKYQVMRALFEAMLAAEQPVYLDFRAAFEHARKLVSQP
jgi:methylene-tetrahydromethanopterin dehydrogenase